MALFTQVLADNIVLGLLARVVVFMTVRSYPGHAAGLHGEARSLAGEELEKD